MKTPSRRARSSSQKLHPEGRHRKVGRGDKKKKLATWGGARRESPRAIRPQGGAEDNHQGRSIPEEKKRALL